MYYFIVNLFIIIFVLHVCASRVWYFGEIVIMGVVVIRMYHNLILINIQNEVTISGAKYQLQNVRFRLKDRLQISVNLILSL